MLILHSTFRRMPRSSPMMEMWMTMTIIRITILRIYDYYCLYGYDYKFYLLQECHRQATSYVFFNIDQKHGMLIYLTYAAVYIAYFVVGISYVLDFGLNVHRWRTQRDSVRDLFIHLIHSPSETRSNRRR